MPCTYLRIMYSNLQIICCLHALRTDSEAILGVSICVLAVCCLLATITAIVCSCCAAPKGEANWIHSYQSLLLLVSSPDRYPTRVGRVWGRDYLLWVLCPDPPRPDHRHSLTLVVYVLVVVQGLCIYVCESLKFEGGSMVVMGDNLLWSKVSLK